MITAAPATNHRRRTAVSAKRENQLPIPPLPPSLPPSRSLVRGLENEEPDEAELGASVTLFPRPSALFPTSHDGLISVSIAGTTASENTSPNSAPTQLHTPKACTGRSGEKPNESTPMAVVSEVIATGEASFSNVSATSWT